MYKSDITRYFLENHSLDGAPNVEMLRSIDEIQNGSIIYFSCFTNTELATIEIERMRHCLTHIILDKGKFLSESSSSKFGTSFPKDPLTLPERYLKIYPEDIGKRGIYHTKPF
ncbi:hypothetical protein HQ489_00680 [Candidatus Woesearchaeota archaeon]|nr:hypothetical protein [Candidatus Woesearchaeota archaeon]